MACRVESCSNKLFAKQLCRSHYYRNKEYGNPLAGGTQRGAALSWLERHLSRDNFLDCESELSLNPWPFYRTAGGRPAIRINGKQETLQRIVCRHFNGQPENDSVVVRHLCGKGNLGCIRPQCLVWGTYSENGADAIAHGASTKGERNSNAVLTETDVRAMRKSWSAGVSQDHLAEIYGVTQSCVSRVVNKHTWSFIVD